MDQIMKEHERLEHKSNLKKPIDHIQETIDKLRDARNAITADASAAPVNLAKVQNSTKQLFERLHEDVKDISSGLNNYQKQMNKKFKEKPPTFSEHDILSPHHSLINRAIAMHLLREGHFDVATTFIQEANANPPPVPPPETTEEAKNRQQIANGTSNGVSSRESGQQKPKESTPSSKAPHQTWEADFSPTAYKSASLQRQFSEMYHILHELRQRHNLGPAIEWARAHSSVLEARGSNLEYDLCRLQYISLFNSTEPASTGGPLAAVIYARETFPKFPARYASQTHALLGALAFAPSIGTSPYASLFSPTTASTPSVLPATKDPEDPSTETSIPSNTTAAAAAAFTSEFCALLSLSSASPLLTAVTAGCIALPTLLKLSQIQAQHRTSWTTAAELPVEVPLPPAYQFHSVFVCPVSKEQSTDENPPMMMPCGHLVAKESLERLSRGARFKCPYCPQESHPRDAKKVVLCVRRADLPPCQFDFGPSMEVATGRPKSPNNCDSPGCECECGCHLPCYSDHEEEEDPREVPPRELRCCLDFAVLGVHGPFCPLTIDVGNRLRVFARRPTTFP